MSRQFIPPAVDALRKSPAAELTDERLRIRDDAFGEGYAVGLREGRLAGVREGETRARQEHQAELTALRGKFAKQEALGRVADACDALLAAHDATDRAVEQAVRGTMASALRAIFPVLLSRASGAEVLEVAAEALRLRDPAALTLRAHPDTLALIADQRLPEPAAARLTLAPDPGVAPGAAVVAWSGGGLRFDPADLLERVIAVLSPPSSDAEEYE